MALSISQSLFSNQALLIIIPDPLKIGDYITLRSPRFESFLSAEGILSENLVLNASLSEFDDALFCVHLQRQYSASRELEEFYEQYGYDNKDPSAVAYLQALERGRDNETNLNESHLKNKQGRFLKFGDVVQVGVCVAWCLQGKSKQVKTYFCKIIDILLLNLLLTAIPRKVEKVYRNESEAAC